jgi:hypothetical protein
MVVIVTVVELSMPAITASEIGDVALFPLRVTSGSKRSAKAERKERRILVNHNNRLSERTMQR